MPPRVTGFVRRMIRRVGIDVVRYRPAAVVSFPPDMEPEITAIAERVRPYTMTSTERIYTLCKATQHVTRFGVTGAFVECGVWRGGSMMAAALALLQARRSDRELYLFDTFAGMPEPTREDVDFAGADAAPEWQKRAEGEGSDWCRASLEDVRENMRSTGYPAERVHFVKGKVEDTIPAQAPERIALLRLDTDWYESTRHELEHLYPRLVSGGVLIIDDYGYWKGARKAVDEYLRDLPVLLHRIDHTGRIAVKP